MSFNWNSFYEFAEELKNTSFKNNLEEAKYRTSINRFYYFAYHLVKDSILQYTNLKQDTDKIKEVEKTGSSHSLILQLLMTTSNMTVVEIKSNLEELKELREDVDYRLSDYTRMSMSPQNAASYALIKANSIMTDVAVFQNEAITLDLEGIKRIRNLN